MRHDGVGTAAHACPSRTLSWSVQVHVGLSGDGAVILEYELDDKGPHEQGWLRDAQEALRSERVNGLVDRVRCGKEGNQPRLFVRRVPRMGCICTSSEEGQKNGFNRLLSAAQMALSLCCIFYYSQIKASSLERMAAAAAATSTAVDIPKQHLEKCYKHSALPPLPRRRPSLAVELSRRSNPSTHPPLRLISLERSGRRVIDGPANGQGGLYAVMGPGLAIQIRSWRVRSASTRCGEGENHRKTIAETPLATPPPLPIATATAVRVLRLLAGRIPLLCAIAGRIKPVGTGNI